ncbi:DUF4832 domain-containing protein [bacterium]|nr:DUF4832 domain-containing protein [bacterium]
MKYLWLCLALAALTAGASLAGDNTRRIDLSPAWDDSRVLVNPHKGWYFHYFDNDTVRYHNRLAPGDYLQDFPGLDHIYLRLAWSYLEPEEGVYNWELIDRVIDAWRARGYGVAFRITCKETFPDQTYATPEWVRKAGAKGTMVTNKHFGSNTWEPDYGDPVFLEKLDNFHRAFAARYDGKEWVEYIDIGSYGEWGEGHTGFGTGTEYPFEVLKKHIDLWVRNYRKSRLVINDDFIERADPKLTQILYGYARNSGLLLRDDSICVEWYAQNFGLSTLKNPGWWADFWPYTPTILELEHYQKTIKTDTFKGGVPMTAAMDTMHATYIGFHGDARQFLADNPELTRRLANRCGYWYFPGSIELPRSAAPGGNIEVAMDWLNRGVAPAYNHYPLLLRLSDGGAVSCVLPIEGVDNRQWGPDSVSHCLGRVNLPDSLRPGQYSVAVGLKVEHNRKEWLELPLPDSLKVSDGFYRVADISIR